MLRSFQRTILPGLDRRTTVVILGDGRTNYQNDGAEVLDTIRRRIRSLIWICPEPRDAWAKGDSAMQRYAPYCTRVMVARCARDLEVAVQQMLAAR
jgi:uncharacterized protein